MSNFYWFGNIVKFGVNFLRICIDQILGLEFARKNLLLDVKGTNTAILNNLTNIRLLSFAFLTSPVLSIIPFAITGDKLWGLLNFAIGTLSIIAFLYFFKSFRSTYDPLKLIRLGAISTLILNGITALFLIIASNTNLPRLYFVYIYVSLQIFSGIPFSLISGIDSKLSRSVYEKIRSNKQEVLSPNSEFRKFKTIGSTTAGALGAFAWCIIILINNGASQQPGWYSIIFILNMIPCLSLLWNLNQLKQRLLSITTYQDTDHNQETKQSSESKVNGQRQFHLKTVESVISIGCLEGLLQFSTFYFSISAIKKLFDDVSNYYFLIIIIPIMFYLVNHVEQVGAFLFTKFIPYLKKSKDLDDTNFLKPRQYTSLLIIFIATILFVLHVFILTRFGWLPYFDLLAYAIFNVIKGFAGGLSEEWNESLAENSAHNEATFMTFNSLMGRVYQVAAILFYPVITQFINHEKWFEISNFKALDEEALSIGATLTISFFGLIVANILAFMWLGYAESKEHNTLQTIIESLTQPDKRLALFIQFLRTLFIVFLILSNLLSLKVFDIKGIEFTHGAFFYISSFVILHLIVAFEGIEIATKTVLQGIVTYLLLFVCLTLSASLTGELKIDFITIEVYNRLINSMGYLFLASFAGYASVIILNILLMTILLKYFGIKQSLLITATVTLVTQLIDTIIFVNLGYQDIYGDKASFLFGQFTVKFSVYLVMYFPLYIIICLFRQLFKFEYPIQS